MKRRVRTQCSRATKYAALANDASQASDGKTDNQIGRLEGADPSFDSDWARQNVKNKDTGNSHSDVYRKQFDGIHATAQKAAADMKAKQGIP